MTPGRLLPFPLARPILASRCFHRPPNRLNPPRLRPAVGCGWSARWKSSTVSEKGGHIGLGPNESILYFDNIFPLNLSSILSRPWQTDRELSQLVKKFEGSTFGIMDPINLVKRAIPESIPIKVTEIVPQLKDGGAFVKFTHPPGVSASEIEGTLSRHLEAEPIKPWFNPFRGIRAGLVKGVPWIEDLSRFPRSRLRVEFAPAEAGDTGGELSQEALYGLFRRYGKIADMASQPSDSKEIPRFAHVDFVLVRDAVMARNCLHGLTVAREVGGKEMTRLRISYQKRAKAHHVWTWITSHPRVVIPVVAAFLAAFTVAVFDPIREFFVRAHVRQSFSLSGSRLYKWFERQTSGMLPSYGAPKKSEQSGALWSHRRELVDQVRGWLAEATGTFIVVHGPRGSGKRELVLDQVLGGRSDGGSSTTLVVDCKAVVEARGEAATIRKLAGQVGYRPVFSWANTASSLVDLAVQSTTGVKVGFSETLEAQVGKILQTAAVALKEVSLGGRAHDGADAGLSEDAYLEAHPERRPVVVIDNFLLQHGGEGAGRLVYDKVAEWAAGLVQSNVAHVVFLTSDPSFSKTLSRPLPDREFRQVALGDLTPGAAKRYVLAQGGERQTQEKDVAELDECIESLGGRLTDLNFLARRLRSGQSPKRAVDEIIEQSALDVLRMFLLAKKPANEDQKPQWTPEQAWYLVREIARAGGVLRYNEVLLSSIFASSSGSGESALDGLAAAELIAVSTHRGRPQAVRAGKPVYQAAFSSLLADRALAARMDLALLTQLAAIEARSIDKAEAELALLGAGPLVGSSSSRLDHRAAGRVDYLLAKLQSCQGRIQAYEAEMAGLKKVLSDEA